MGKRQITELVENDEVHAGEVIGEPALPCVAGLGLDPVDEIDHIVEPTARAGADAASGDSDGKMGLAGSSSADQHDIALLDEETAPRKIVDERRVDRCSAELECIEVLGGGQLGDGELVLDRARLLLVDLGLEQIAKDSLRLVLAFNGGAHDLIEGRLHAVELELAHELEELRA